MNIITARRKGKAWEKVDQTEIISILFSMDSPLADLHTHSTLSDGTYTPEALADSAAARDVRTLALTDHDTLLGLPAAGAACRKRGIRFIPGIELEADFEPGELHILGLGLRHWRKGPLAEAMEELINQRNSRNRRMVEVIQADGVPLEWEELEEISGGEVIARPHFADLLVRHGRAESRMDAFQRFLTPGKPYYLPRKALSPEEALSLIRSAGGVPILAHPHTLHVSWGRLPSLIDPWKEMGLEGIEAFHSGARYRDAHRLSALAEEKSLLISGGSDFHGGRRPDRKLGRGPDQGKLHEDFFRPLLEKLLEPAT